MGNHSQTTSRRQGRKGDRPSEGSRSAKPGADEQKRHTKAESLGKPAQHGTAHGSGDTVNDAVARGKSATLIRGDLIDDASCAAGSAPVSNGGRDRSEVSRSHSSGRETGLPGDSKGLNTDSGREPRQLRFPSRTPTGGDGKPRTDGQPSPTVNLLERILDPVNVRLAWRRVRSNKGAPGVDAVTIGEFPSRFRPQWPEIRQALVEGRYRPSPVRKVSITKPSGGTRHLGIPTVLDRLIQQAIAQILTPIIDPTFSESSHGFRPGRSKHAVMCGLSRQAYWYLARALGTQSGMTDRWLATQGLLSVRELWIAVHYPSDKRKVDQ